MPTEGNYLKAPLKENIISVIFNLHKKIVKMHTKCLTGNGSQQLQHVIYEMHTVSISDRTE